MVPRELLAIRRENDYYLSILSNNMRGNRVRIPQLSKVEKRIPE